MYLDDWGIIIWLRLIQTNILKWFAVSVDAPSWCNPTYDPDCFPSRLTIYKQGLYSASIHLYNKLARTVMLNILNIAPAYNTQMFESVLNLGRLVSQIWFGWQRGKSQWLEVFVFWGLDSLN